MIKGFKINGIKFIPICSKCHNEIKGLTVMSNKNYICKRCKDGKDRI